MGRSLFDLHCEQRNLDHPFKKGALKTARGIKTAFPDGVSVSAVREAMSEMSGVAQRQVSDRIRTLGSATKNTLESDFADVDGIDPEITFKTFDEVEGE